MGLLRNKSFSPNKTNGGHTSNSTNKNVKIRSREV